MADTIIDNDPDEAVRLLEEAAAAVESADVTFMVSLIRSSLVTAHGRSTTPLRAVPGYLELLPREARRLFGSRPR